MHRVSRSSGSGLPVGRRARTHPTGWGRAVLFAALLGWLLSAGAVRVTAQVSREYDLKAVFLYNLASFVEWPSSAFAGPEAPFVIGVLGRDPFGQVLDDIIANEFVGRRPIVARRLRRGDDVTACQVLFVADSESRRLADILRSLRSRPVLTVGDLPGFVQSGGMIGFGRRGEHLELLVNPPAVRAADLVVSSKLLEVARVVEAFAGSP